MSKRKNDTAKGKSQTAADRAKKDKPKDKAQKPVVFMFQLEDFVPVKADRLKEWEKSLVDRVRLHPQAAASLASLVGTAITGTFSRTSPSNGQFDDCDQD